MPFIQDILKYKSLSIIGMEKNTGKTEALNYILRRLESLNKNIAVTSIGIDGENKDLVTNTHKPEIQLQPGTIFVTSEKHYREKTLVSEILAISEERTSLGRLITARVAVPGKIIISGPPTNSGLKKVIQEMEHYDRDITLIDGALSRRSLASPSITESLVLTTGAALSHHIPELVRKTKQVHSLILLEQFSTPYTDTLLEIEKGIWAIDSNGEVHDLNIPSSLLLNQYKDRIFNHGKTLFISGILSDNMLNFLRIQEACHEICVIVKDFTKIFASAESLNAFIKKGGTVKVLSKAKLIAVCINPVSPAGYIMDSEKLKAALMESLEIPVYNIKSDKL